ncbi:winged helix-turn-helix domain-containing protein [Kibdelosporangium philippinense]|uniref:Winged helix-turn-helix domain-containing protein n=1 Tax=Kibdelosporangium philippinense TaxID=211113 RepID=A0ABS8Z0F9_9PSEU|nr:BTAD domain-containing putative transcriptional regulator [Kibdelosporangium philippinense]MCE7001456.1 winged helix-turn-helix domain-containing protein [Kibdelosporangium philippinense]
MSARDAEGRVIELGGPKVRALLAVLLTEPGTVVPTERLLDGLYGQHLPDNAANALQSHVSRLRRSIGADRVELHTGGYRLVVDPSDVDAAKFAELVAEATRARPERAERLLGEALALWRGPAPEELGAYGHKLTEARLAASEDQIAAQLAQGRQDLVPRLRELVAQQPLRERLRVLLMRALASSGRPAEALTAYEEARRTLVEELGTDPSKELADAHMEILTGDQPAIRRVPAQLSSFVGRADELTRLADLLTSKRLVTLTGPGGTGKTRLAIEAVKHRNDVCFVELADVLDDLPQVVLAALGMRANRPPATPEQRLHAALRDRPMLLVFDNCEHVIEAAANLAKQLLSEHPDLRLLTTSREPLGITGEAIVSVPTLDIAEAVRLFADRAGTPAEEEVPRICAALDGLPLAIELAAARVRTLPIAQLAARLDDRFTLLSNRTADARHRTLRTVVSWSWDLLDDQERAVAARLTVFSGGATLNDAEAVCGSPDTMTLLPGLVDKSLVELVGDRYRMLETIRAFCAEQLGDATEETTRRHAEHFLAFAEEANDRLLTKDQLAWLARLDTEHDNLHAALRWAAQADPFLALRLVGALSTYWWMRGRRFEAAKLCRDLAIRIGPQPPDGLTEEFLLCVANTDLRDGHLEAVRHWATRRGAPPKHPFTLVVLAPVVGPPPSTVQHMLLGEDPWSRALESLGQGYLDVFNGDVDEAEQNWRTALEKFRAVGERWGIMQALGELGTITSWRGEHERATGMLGEAIELAGTLGATEELCDMVARRGDAYLAADDFASAARDYERVLTLGARLASPVILAGARLGLATLARLSGDIGEARRLIDLAYSEVGAGWFSPDWTRTQILVEAGWIACAEGKAAEAAMQLHEALTEVARWEHMPMAGAVAEALADVALLSSDPTRAARLLGMGSALGAVAAVDVARVTADATAAIGDSAFSTAYAIGRDMSRKTALEWLLTEQTHCGPKQTH